MVRMPDGMRDQIAEAAKANNRSMNAEIIARLSATQSNLSPSQALDAIILLTQDRSRVELQVKHLYFELSILASHFVNCLSKFPSDAIKPGSALEKELEDWRQLAQETYNLAKPHVQPDDAIAAVKEFQAITEKARKRVPAAYPPGEPDWPKDMERFESADLEPPSFAVMRKRIKANAESKPESTAKRTARAKKT